jgi:hypothetical protein
MLMQDKKPSERDCEAVRPEHGEECGYVGDALDVDEAMETASRDWPWSDDHDHLCAHENGDSEFEVHKWSDDDG